MTKPTEHTRTFFLFAGSTDAEGCMSMSLIVQRAIEVATEHANMLGLGYEALIKHGVGWVLTRMSVDMLSYPRINDTYSITTWIEGYNRLYSDRCYLITDGYGNTIGNIRSMWVAMDMKTRTAGDLTPFEPDSFPISERACPVARQRKLPPLPQGARQEDFTFRYSDLDFNRHVNTVQYVRQFLNQWPLDFFDQYEISHMDIAFHHECHYQEQVSIRVSQHDDNLALCEIVNAEGNRAVAASFNFKPRK